MRSPGSTASPGTATPWSMIGQYWSIQGLIGSLKSSMIRTKTPRFGGPLRFLLQAKPRPCRALATACALTVLLDRWARHSAEGTEHAAIPRQWLKPLSATGTVLEKLAGIRWHGLGKCWQCGQVKTDRSCMPSIANFGKETQLTTFQSVRVTRTFCRTYCSRARIFRSSSATRSLRFLTVTPSGNSLSVYGI